MSPTHNGSIVLQCSKRSNVVKICNGIMFDFYPGLPQIQTINIDSGLFYFSLFVQRVVLATHQSVHQMGMDFTNLYVFYCVRLNCRVVASCLCFSFFQYGAMLDETTVSKITVSFVCI